MSTCDDLPYGSPPMGCVPIPYWTTPPKSDFQDFVQQPPTFAITGIEVIWLLASAVIFVLVGLLIFAVSRDSARREHDAPVPPPLSGGEVIPYPYPKNQIEPVIGRTHEGEADDRTTQGSGQDHQHLHEGGDEGPGAGEGPEPGEDAAGPGDRI